MAQNDQDANADEGSGPEADVKAQNPGGTTTADQTDAGDEHKTEKLTKAGRDDLDPNASE